MKKINLILTASLLLISGIIVVIYSCSKSDVDQNSALTYDQLLLDKGGKHIGGELSRRRPEGSVLLATYSEGQYTYIIDSVDRVEGMQNYYDDSINPRSEWVFDSTWVQFDQSESPGVHIFEGVAYKDDSILTMGFQISITSDSIYIIDRPYTDLCLKENDCCNLCAVLISGCYCDDVSTVQGCTNPTPPGMCRNVFSRFTNNVTAYF